MSSKEFRLYGKTFEDAAADMLKKGAYGRLVLLKWPPLRDTQGWERLRALAAPVPTTFAVRVFPDRVQTTKAYDEYLERYFRFVESAVEFDSSETIHEFSATNRTCKSCGSHVAVEHVDGEACPVCGADLRSNTVRKTIARWEERIAKVCEQGEAEAVKAGWLGGWVGVSVGGRKLEEAEAKMTALRRRYDSSPVASGAVQGASLHMSAGTWEALAGYADSQGLAPAECIKVLIARAE